MSPFSVDVLRHPTTEGHEARQNQAEGRATRDRGSVRDGAEQDVQGRRKECVHHGPDADADSVYAALMADELSQRCGDLLEG